MPLIQAQVAKRGLRIAEFFHDFDRLRTGTVTKAQFTRCLGQLDLRLQDKQLQQLHQAFEGPAKDLVDYRRFCDAVDARFVGKDLERNPNAFVPQASVRDFAQPSLLEPELEDIYDGLIEQIRTHCATYGLNVRDAFKDFDRVNRGVVTESQFQRNLPRPSTFTPVDLQIVIEKHRDPEDPGMIQYMPLYREVAGIVVQQPTTLRLRETLKRREPVVSATEVPVDELLRQLQLAFYKGRVRALQFFQDYDRLRSSYVTPHQFICGLSLACSGPGFPRFSRADMQRITDAYTSDRGVNYRDFCKDADETFLTGMHEDMTQQPTAETRELTRSELVHEYAGQGQPMSPELEELLADIRTYISAQRLDPYPHFREFDRRLGFTKGVTTTQFHRLLDMTLKRPFSEAQVALLADYFRHPESQDVNYHAFLAHVDAVSKLADTLTDKLYFDTRSVADFPTLADVVSDDSAVELDIDSARDWIVAKCITRSLRAAEYLRDFDKLRRGFITPAQFQQGLRVMVPQIPTEVLRSLTVAYTDPSRPAPTTVDWRRFVHDVDDALNGGAALEKDASRVAPDLNSTARSLARATIQPPEARGFTDETFAEYDDAMDNIRQQKRNRALEVRGILRDFDRTRQNRVTPRQFQQALDTAGFRLSERELTLVTTYYMDGDRINYADFLEDIEPSEKLENKTLQGTQRLNALNKDRRAAIEAAEPAHFEAVLAKVKTLVAKERMRISEHLRDFDKLRRGMITANQFRAGLSMAKVELTLPEMRALEEHYRIMDQGNDFVAYTRFCRDVESVFTLDDLHTQPLADAVPTIPPVGVELAAQERMRELKSGHENKALQVIAAEVKRRRMLLQHDFKDFDKIHRGVVTKDQFFRVLTDLNLGQLLTNEEREQLAEHYSARVGGRWDVHYRQFIDDVEQYGEVLHRDFVNSQ